MKNYYEEFGISSELSLEEIQKHLVTERKKWSLRLNAADLDRRQKAEQKLNLLDEAVKVFIDDYSKKKYDAELRKSGQETTIVKQEVEQINDNQGYDEVWMRIENLYESGNTQATIDLCNQAIMCGLSSREIYGILINAYGENGDFDQAIATGKAAMKKYPEDLDIKFSVARLYLHINENIDQVKNIIDEILQKMPNANGALATQVELDLRKGNKEKADKDVEEYINKYPNDAQYKEMVSLAYSRCGEYFLSIAPNGANYFNSKENYDQCLEMRKKSYEINPCEATKEDYEEIKKYGAKTFDTSLIGGIAAAVVISLFFMDSYMIVSVGLWALSIWMLVSAFEPKWQVDRGAFTGSRKPANTVAYILTTIVKAVWRFIWGLISGIFNFI